MKINRLISIIATTLFLTACVSGAPHLTTEQSALVKEFPVFKQGDSPEVEYSIISEISGADCSGAPYGGRIWGDAEKAIETLKAKAIHIGADAVINVSCGAIPFLNNCWAAQKCSGEAVAYE